MIVSSNGTSYDTSDGSQQPHERSAEGRQRSDREQISRWEDDGPGPQAIPHPAPAAGETARPAWSVLSLTNLLEAIRQLGDEPAGAAAARKRERAERDRLAAERLRLDVAAAAAAERNRYRNAWENA
jgi:hypothetical protein